MAKVIQTVTNILFDSVDELTKMAVKYLKRRLNKDSIEEFSTFVSGVVTESLRLQSDWSLAEYVGDLSLELNECGYNDIAQGNGLGERCGFEEARQALTVGGSLDLQPNCLGLYALVSHNDEFKFNIQCWTTEPIAMQLLELAFNGELAFVRNSRFTQVMSHETKAEFHNFIRGVKENAAGEVSETPATILDVVTEANVEEVLAPDTAPATITLRVPATPTNEEIAAPAGATAQLKEDAPQADAPSGNDQNG